MASLHCPIDDVLVVAVDIQPSFMSVIHEAERVVSRSQFLIRCAQILGIPGLATIQNPAKMGGFDESFRVESPISKMAFSCWGSGEFQNALAQSGRKNVVLVGIETHICVTLTALDLMEAGYKVFVCPDAVSARNVERHKLGMERMRDSGVMASHTETLVYEWMKSADHPNFREVLKVVKETP